MSTDPLSFLDQPDLSSQGSSKDPLDFLDNVKTMPKALRYGAQAAIGGAQVAATPYELAVAPLASKSAQHGEYRKSLFEDIERLQEQKQAGVWDEKDQQLYDHLVEQVKSPEKAEQFVKTKDIGVEALAEKGAEQLGFDLTPEDLSEELTRIGGGFLDPKKVASKLKDLPSLLTKEGRVAYSAKKVAEKASKQWDSLATASKGHAEKEGLLDWAKELGLSPQAATLLLQSKGKADILGKIAKKTKNYKGAVKELNEKLGKNYERLKEVGRKGGRLSNKQTEGLSNDLSHMVSDMDRTLIQGPDTKAARNILEEALFKLESEGATVEDLINSRLNLSQSINWKAVDPKGAMLKKGRESFMKAIEKTNPGVAKELRMTDQSWSKYLRYAKNLDKKQALLKIAGNEVPVDNIVFATALKFGMGASVPVVAKTLLAKEGIQRLATSMVTNPKLQGIHRQLMKASIEGSKEKQKALLMTMKKILKEDDPELYSELDFSP